jgi:hypothetical protein
MARRRCIGNTFKGGILTDSSIFSFIVCFGFCGMADGKSKSDMRSTVVDDDFAASVHDPTRWDGVMWRICARTLSAVNALAHEIEAAKTAAILLERSFMLSMTVLFLLYHRDLFTDYYESGNSWKKSSQLLPSYFPATSQLLPGFW